MSVLPRILGGLAEILIGGLSTWVQAYSEWMVRLDLTQLGMGTLVSQVSLGIKDRSGPK